MSEPTVLYYFLFVGLTVLAGLLAESSGWKFVKLLANFYFKLIVFIVIVHFICKYW